MASPAKPRDEVNQPGPLPTSSAAAAQAQGQGQDQAQTQSQTQTSQSTIVESPLIRWIIAVTVSSAALLEVIDTSIVNVALNQIQGNLGATLAEAGWVVTGYSVANAVMIPLTAWMGDRFGKKAYFVFSLIGFTISSMMCGFAPNLTTLVVSRIIQGLCGGGLLAKAQAILFETFPKEEQPAAQGLFGICVMVGPVVVVTQHLAHSRKPSWANYAIDPALVKKWGGLRAALSVFSNYELRFFRFGCGTIFVLTAPSFQ